jgi:outer membrane protein TolC
MKLRHLRLVPIAVLLVGLTQVVWASKPNRGDIGLTTYQPPHNPGAELSLVDAVMLAIRNDPNVYQARESSLQLSGTLQQSNGLFDTTFQLDTSYSLNTSELTDGQRKVEEVKRKAVRDLGTILQDIADDLRAQLEEDGFVFPNCDHPLLAPGSILIIGGEAICVSAEQQANIQLTGDLAGALGLDETQDNLVEWSRSIAATLVPILDQEAAELREKLRRLGLIPDYEDKTTISFDLGLAKTFRNGIFVRPGVSFESVKDVFRGKRREGAWGGKGKPDTTTSVVSLRADFPLGKGRGVVSTGAAERAARLNYEASLQSEAHTIAESALRTSLAYWNVVAAVERLELQSQSVEINERINEVASALVDVGEMVEGDLAQSRARLAEARAQYVQQQQSVRQNAVALADAIGLLIQQIEEVPVTTESWPDDPTEVEIDQLEGGSLVDVAREHRGDLLAARLRQESAVVLAKAARADLKAKTDLSLEVSYRGFHEGHTVGTVDGLLNHWGDALFGWVPGPSGKLSLNFEWPFGNNSARGRYEESRSLLHQAAISSTDLDRVIGANVERLVGSLVEAALEVRDREQSASYYRQMLEAELDRFELGEASVVDIIFTEQDQISQRLALVTARLNLTSLLTQLRFETGTLLRYRTEEGGVVVEDVQPYGYRFVP